jgi:hypothetical protein
MRVASRRMPTPRAVAKTLRVTMGPLAREAKASIRTRAALVTSRPVRPMPSVMAVSVEWVVSWASRKRDEDFDGAGGGDAEQA